MREKIHSGAAWACLLGGIALVFGGLVWAAFGRSHTKVVSRTKMVVVARKVAATFDGNPQTMAEYIGATGGEATPCPDGAKSVVCYRMQSATAFVFLAVPKPDAS